MFAGLPHLDSPSHADSSARTCSRSSFIHITCVFCTKSHFPDARKHAGREGAIVAAGRFCRTILRPKGDIRRSVAVGGPIKKKKKKKKKKNPGIIKKKKK
eukprot:NODE_23236_length_675_cov_1.540146.p2 GENE.NODE_23236_length_675_cov_1.540146~~NODE_23236_length_675_cov_1.540146.p2  ORF type:complete len:100 (+),score=25.78 NODE_23236_length_675_cov_1.540146:287-586(+)